MKAAAGVVFDAIGGFLVDDGWPIASHIALSMLTSMFPFLIFITALAGFLGASDLASEATRLIFEAWPKVVAGPIAGEVHSVLTQPRGGLLTIGAVLALYFSSSGVEALRTGLNRAYDALDHRPWWLLRLQSILFMMVASFGLLALAFLVVLGPLIWAQVIDFAPQLAPLQQLVTIVRLGIATVVLCVTLLVAHLWLPAVKLRFLDVAPGVILTFVGSVGFGEAFGLYLSEFARNYVSTYAGLASVMITLVFLYVIAAIFVFGGELNAAILRRGRREKVRVRRAARVRGAARRSERGD
ncbi:MAG TPA: YihY/virulence factor BrkB family protein [Roseiarcus sp.]|nr:YihY/virulence factor BrkB family protein [Roseiarcus sp.]